MDFALEALLQQFLEPKIIKQAQSALLLPESNPNFQFKVKYAVAKKRAQEIFHIIS